MENYLSYYIFSFYRCLIMIDIIIVDTPEIVTIPSYGKHNIYDYYENDSFPMFGWVKPCYYCNYVGSSFMTRVYMDKTIIIHACRRCIKKHKYNIAKEKVIHKCLKNAIYITPDPEDFIIS